MSKQIHQQVRQALMNELGLTRESVRAEMEKIVADTIERAFNTSEVNSRITRIIEGRVQTALNAYRYGSGDLEKLIRSEVTREVKEQVSELVKDQVIVSLSLAD